MKMLWTWGGKFFGYRDGDCLWTQQGNHVGRFDGNNIYDADGHYIGEVMDNERLIYDLSKSNQSSYGFNPFMNRVSIVPYVDYVGNVMYLGYKDFDYKQYV